MSLHISFVAWVAHRLITSSSHPSLTFHSIYLVPSIFLLPFLISSLLIFQLQIKVQESFFSSKFLHCYLLLFLLEPTLISCQYMCLYHPLQQFELYISAVSRNIAQAYLGVSTFLDFCIFFYCWLQINLSKFGWDNF